MPNPFRRPFLLISFVLGALCFAPEGRAQLANLDHLAEKFAKQLKSQKPKLIAVADFTSSWDAPASQGHYFANFFSGAIDYYSKKKLLLTAHPDFDAELAKVSLTPASFSNSDAANQLAGKVPQDIVVIGAVGRDAEDYNFKVSALRVSDGKILFSDSAALHRTEFMDSFSEPFPPKTDQPIQKSSGKLSSGSVPTCSYCPSPPYTDFARREKIMGTSVFEVLVSPNGEAVSLHPIKLAGYGLDEQAFNTLKTWRFNPAVNPQGVPVYVVVPIEVTFRLY